MGTKWGDGQKRKCVICGCQFTRQGKRATCSIECRDALVRAKEEVQSLRDAKATCSICGNKTGARSKKFCSNECIHIAKSIRSRHALASSIKNGTHKGWATRGVMSYAEKFWSSVLEENNIQYEREKAVSGYFLDFVIDNVDLEIDGKQHAYPERAASDQRRDRVLSKLGYSVYRIPWINPNTEEAKLQVKEQIESFLTYLEVRDGE